MLSFDYQAIHKQVPRNFFTLPAEIMLSDAYLLVIDSDNLQKHSLFCLITNSEFGAHNYTENLNKCKRYLHTPSESTGRK